VKLRESYRVPDGFEPVVCPVPECDGKPGECRVENWEMIVKDGKGNVQAQAMKSYYCRKCGAPIPLR
jgi:hypothetical protein